MNRWNLYSGLMPYVISKKCTKCGACLLECPTGSIMEGDEAYVIDADTCGDHAACAAVCPVDAIQKLQVVLPGKDDEEEEEEEE